jgi:hypothetical protein
VEEMKMEETKTIKEWVCEFSKATGKNLSLNTVRKRRAISGLGTVVPPKMYLLTKEEFLAVLATPLPMCTCVIEVHDAAGF